MLLIATMLDSIGLRSQNLDATLGHFDLKFFPFFITTIQKTLGCDKLFLWSRSLIMSGPWKSFQVSSSAAGGISLVGKR